VLGLRGKARRAHWREALRGRIGFGRAHRIEDAHAAEGCKLV